MRHQNQSLPEKSKLLQTMPGFVIIQMTKNGNLIELLASCNHGLPPLYTPLLPTLAGVSSFALDLAWPEILYPLVDRAENDCTIS